MTGYHSSCLDACVWFHSAANICKQWTGLDLMTTPSPVKFCGSVFVLLTPKVCAYIDGHIVTKDVQTLVCMLMSQIGQHLTVLTATSLNCAAATCGLQ